MTKANMVELPIGKVTSKEMVVVIKTMKPGKAAELWEEMISASGEVGISVMMERVCSTKNRGLMDSK